MMSILLDASLRSLLLGLAVWLGLRVWRVRNPQIEATAWIVVLSAALSMPLLLRWPILHLMSTAAPALPLDLPLAVPPAEPRARAVLGPIVPALPLRHADPMVALSTLLPLIYTAIAGGMLFRLLAGLTRTWQILRQAVPVDADWVRINQIAGIDIRVTEAVKAPVTVGRAILLPAGCYDWSPAKRAAVLCHERSHIEHHDFTVQLLSRVHTAIFWFSPLAWWLQLRLAYLAETTSDEAAVRQCGNRIDYAEILLDLAVGARDLPSGVAMARPAMLRQRIDRLLSRAVPAIVLTRRRRLMVAASLLPIVLLVGGTAWHAQAEDPPSAAPANPDPTVPPPPSKPLENAPLPSPTPAIPAEPSATGQPTAERSEAGSDHDSFAIIKDGTAMTHGGGADLEHLMAVRRDHGSHVILFRHDGKTYAITDPTLVEEAASLFRPQHNLGEQQRNLGERQRDLGRQQSELGRQETEIGRHMTEFAQRRQVRDEVRRALDSARAALARSEDATDSKDDPDLGEVHALSERAIAEVSRELDQLTKQSLTAAGDALGGEEAGDRDESAEEDHGSDRRMADMSQQMAQLAQRQRDLAAKQEALSAQQEALSREQSATAHDAAAKMQALIARVLASGAATPVQ
jgi:beta-lactamase regulating signal transducer with metallopeptidase domain